MFNINFPTTFYCIPTCSVLCLSGNGSQDCFAGALHLVHLFLLSANYKERCSRLKTMFLKPPYGSYSNIGFSSKLRLPGFVTPDLPFPSGQGRIRTSEGVSQQIYSLPRLTTSVPTHYNCTPTAIRTQDPQLRRLLLYPAELSGQNIGKRYFNVFADGGI